MIIIMNKKLIISFVLSATIMGMVVALINAKETEVIRKTESQFNSYTLNINQYNTSFLPASKGSGQSDDSNSPTTINGNPIHFSYTNAMAQSDYAAKVYRDGTFANVTPLTGLVAVTVTYTGAQMSLSFGDSTSNYGESINITSGIRYQINELTHFKATASGNGTSYIKTLVAEYTCSTESSLDPVMDHTHHGYHYLAKEPTEEKPGNREFYACEECSYVSLVKEDDGVYVDTILTYDLDSSHIAYLAPLNPHLHNEYLRQPTQYDYPIAVSLEIPSSGYSLDNTGVSDASTVIQNALNYVCGLGGGTLYIPSGKYLLANQISIPNRVSLVGDFKGPGASDYGTVFLCTKSYNGGNTVKNNAQVVVQSNSGINGITFYYPNQNINSVTPYGNTIYVDGAASASLINLFFINAYDGIAVNTASSAYGGELTNLENIYGTFLHSGISGFYETDVGYWSNIHISPSYYETAISEFRCSNSTTLYRYTRDNLTGLILGDLDDFAFNKIYIDNANTGILFTEESARELQGFWGFFNDVHLTDCVTGMYVKHIFYSGSALFTHSQLGIVVNVTDYGILKLAKCEWDQLIGDGKTVIEVGSENYEAAPSYNEDNTYNIPSNLYYFDSFDDTGATDISSALQEELDKLHDGGLVLLKNGVYRLDNPITIPNNVMLTSFANTYSRSRAGEYNNELVKFISYSNDSCVKLGNYAGINCIRIYNALKDIDTAQYKLANSISDSFVAVKGVGNNCFAINSEATYTFTGFDFSNSSNHYMKYCYGSAYETFIKAGNSGKIIASLSNLNYLSRSSIAQYAVSNVSALEKYINFESDNDTRNALINFTRTYSTMINVNSSNELVLNCFSYGIKCLINSSSSTLLAVNTSLDNLLENNYCYVINGGDATICNTFRVFGKSFNLVSGHLSIYGRFDFNIKREKSFDSNVDVSDEEEGLPNYYVSSEISRCENKTNTDGVTMNYSSSYRRSGSGSWKAAVKANPAIAYHFSNRDISSFMSNGYLRFYLYCSNINYKGHDACVELTSGGTCDVDEINFNINNQIKVTGWNEILLELTSKQQGPGTFDATKCNYFRFYLLESNCDYYIDDIYFLYDGRDGDATDINNCESISSTNGVILDSFRMHGLSSWKSADMVNAVFACTFSSKNISSYMSSGYVSFYFYCPDVDKLGDYVFLELTSSGNCDNEEITRSIKEYITHDGWNHVKVPLSTMYDSGTPGTFDATRCNFFRIYTLNSSTYLFLDHIQLVN